MSGFKTTVPPDYPQSGKVHIVADCNGLADASVKSGDDELGANGAKPPGLKAPSPRSAARARRGHCEMPPALCEKRIWVCWQWQWKEEADKSKSKWDKPPVDPKTGKDVDATDSTRWMTFDEALLRSDSRQARRRGACVRAGNQSCGNGRNRSGQMH